MGQFTNSRSMKIFSTAMALVIVIINIGFVAASLTNLKNSWWLWTLVVLGASFYFAFVAYLTVFMCICLGWESLVDYKWVQNNYWVEDWVEDRKLRKEILEKTK